MAEIELEPILSRQCLDRPHRGPCYRFVTRSKRGQKSVNDRQAKAQLAVYDRKMHGETQKTYPISFNLTSTRVFVFFSLPDGGAGSRTFSSDANGCSGRETRVCTYAIVNPAGRTTKEGMDT